MADSDAILHKTHIANTPAILSPSTGAVVLSSNQYRGAFMIQNLGTNPLFVLLGDGATTSVFHVILKAATSSTSGDGGVMSMESGTIYTGDISVAGTSPSLVVTELN